MPIDLPIYPLDDAALWGVQTPGVGATLQGTAVTVTCQAGGSASLISGDISAALGHLAPDAPMLGLLDKVPEGAYALRIARDRMLLITPAPLRMAAGWQAGWGLSLADDLYTRVSVDGPASDAVLSTSLSAPAGSPSACAEFGGHHCLIVRHRGGVLFHVPRPEAAALWLRMSRILSAL